MDKTPNPFLYTLRLPVAMPASVNRAVIVAHAFTLSVPWFSSLALTYQSLICLLVLISCIRYCLRMHNPNSFDNIEQLILDVNDTWSIRYSDGKQDRADYGKYQFVHDRLTVLSLKRGEKHLFFVYTPEILATDDFRRLRVRLIHRLQPNG